MAAASHAAEVSELKRRPERTKNELGEVKVRLQRSKVRNDLLYVRERISNVY